MRAAPFVVPSRPVAVTGVLAGAGLVLLAAGRTWASQRVTGVPGAEVVTRDGRAAAPVVTAAALVAAAGALALVLAGRVARRAVAVALLLAGLTVAAATIPVLADPGAAVAPAVAAATGQAGPGTGAAVAGGARSGAWPWAALAGAAVIGAGAGLTLLRGGSWGTGSRRFDPTDPTGGPGAAPGGGAGGGPDTWDALSRGEDPTA